eukprot:scaffold12684_cov45-Cyclotella_meneghiniana.AAC.2
MNSGSVIGFRQWIGGGEADFWREKVFARRGKGLKLKDDNDVSEECKSAKRALFKAGLKDSFSEQILWTQANRQKQPFYWGHHCNMPTI